MPASVIDNVVSLSKRRGFVFPSGEIYGGTRSAWDYGPLGVELKENIKRQWWRAMVQRRDDVVGLDSSVILPRPVWEASGHVDVFTDPLIECQHCHKRFREDHLQEAYAAKKGIENPDDVPMAEVVCPHCGKPFAWRKKWARDWDDVRWCSDACRRSRPGRWERWHERDLAARVRGDPGRPRRRRRPPRRSRRPPAARRHNDAGCWCLLPSKNAPAPQLADAAITNVLRRQRFSLRCRPLRRSYGLSPPPAGGARAFPAETQRSKRQTNIRPCCGCRSLKSARHGFP